MAATTTPGETPGIANYLQQNVGASAPAAIASGELSASDAASNAAVTQGRLLRDYGQQQLPQLVNQQAANGTFYGGQAGVQADNLTQGVNDQYGDVQRQLDQFIANSRRAGVLAATGMAP